MVRCGRTLKFCDTLIDLGVSAYVSLILKIKLNADTPKFKFKLFDEFL